MSLFASYPKSDEHILNEPNEKQRKIDNEFWMTCAISAMQGMQESGTKISILSDVFPTVTTEANSILLFSRKNFAETIYFLGAMKAMLFMTRSWEAEQQQKWHRFITENGLAANCLKNIVTNH